MGIGAYFWVSFCEQEIYAFSLSFMCNMDAAELISNSFIKFKLRLLCNRSLCLMPLSLLFAGAEQNDYWIGLYASAPRGTAQDFCTDGFLSSPAHHQ